MKSESLDQLRLNGADVVRAKMSVHIMCKDVRAKMSVQRRVCNDAVRVVRLCNRRRVRSRTPALSLGDLRCN